MKTEQDILIVDSGIGFTESNVYGVEVVLADFTYIEKNKDKVRGIVISHGHEDHIGAIPYLLEVVNVPIYSTPFPNRLITRKVEECSFAAELVTVEQYQSYSIGDFSVMFVPTDHSIEETSSLKIQVLGKTIFCMSDFKIANNRKGFSERVKKAGVKNCDLLFLDSTNVQADAWTEDEGKVIPNLKEIVEKAEKKIFFTTFASNTKRIQNAMTLAKESGRKVFLIGQSMHVYSAIARDLGYIKFDNDDVKDIVNVSSYPDEKIFIIATGSQGENRSMLKRLSLDEMKALQISKGDTVVFSSKIIPGNEKSIRVLKNDLSRLEAHVFCEETSDIHVSGHAYRQELCFAIETIKPKNFIPVHGEYRFLKQHARMALNFGIKEPHVLVVENGQEVFLGDEGLIQGDFHNITPIALDFINREYLDDDVLRERKKIAKNWNACYCYSY